MGAWNQGYWFEFESKMASATKVVFIDDRIMDVVFLISLTQIFSQTLLLPIPTSFLFCSVYFFSRQYILNQKFSEFNKSAMC